MKKRISLFVFLLFVSIAVSAGSIYKWRDENGKLHFSQKPPPSTAKRMERTEGVDPNKNSVTTRWSEGMKNNAQDFMGRAGVRRVWIDKKGKRVKSRNRYE